jgi:hypothetical protein
MSSKVRSWKSNSGSHYESPLTQYKHNIAKITIKSHANTYHFTPQGRKGVWKTAMQSSTVNVGLSAARKMVGEARCAGMKLWREFDVPE